MKTVDSFIKFMLDNGLVFEINRRVLHPLGLALITDVDRNKKKKLVFDLVETDDPAGFIYDPESFDVGNEKFTKFLGKKEYSDRLDARRKKYKITEQEAPDDKQYYVYHEFTAGPFSDQEAKTMAKRMMDTGYQNVKVFTKED